MKGLLIALCLLWSAAAHAFGHCTSGAYMESFFSDLGAQPHDCDVIDDTLRIRWTGHDVPMRLVKLHDSPQALTTEDHAALQDLAGKIGGALGQMGPVSLEPITVLYRDTEAKRPQGHPELYGEVAHAWGRPGECTITFWKGSGQTREEHLATIAHEMFHCVQRATWPGDQNNRGWWWAEGTATYFAYLVLRGTIIGDGVFRIFDQLIPTTSLVDLGGATCGDHGCYATATFFLWLGETQGPAAITNFILAMPDRSDHASQLAAVQRVVTADTWVAFAKAYHDRSIHKPGGASIDSQPAFGNRVNVAEGTQLAMPSVPYAVQSQLLAFRQGSRFTIESQHKPSDARVQWKQRRTGAWSLPSNSLTTCAGEELEGMVWVTTTSSTAGEMRFHEDHSSQVCTCPAGNWVETPESLHHYFEQAARLSPKLLNGTRRLVINSDSTGSFRYTRIELETPHNSDGQFTNWTLDGTATFKWHLSGDMILTVLERTPSPMLQKHSTFHGHNGMLDVRDMRVMGQTIGHHFRCDGDRLILTNPPQPAMMGQPAPDADMTFVRETPAPPSP